MWSGHLLLEAAYGSGLQDVCLHLDRPLASQKAFKRPQVRAPLPDPAADENHGAGGQRRGWPGVRAGLRPWEARPPHAGPLPARAWDHGRFRASLPGAGLCRLPRRRVVRPARCGEASCGVP